MTVLVLNPDLTQETLAPGKRKDVLVATLTEGAFMRDWNAQTITIKEKLYATNLPEDAPLYHQNYLGYLEKTYAAHCKIVLSPQVFWYTILCEIAQHVIANAEQHRPLFTRDPEGKIDIIVPCSSLDEPLRMDAIHDEMIGHVPLDTALFLPEFTTSTEMSRLASLAAFLETCSPYYNYMMMLCGHAEVKLLGTAGDWDAILDRLEVLTVEFGRVRSDLKRWISKTVLPVAEKIRHAFDGQNADWFQRIYTEKRCGSGGQIDIDGWFCRMFMVQPKYSPRSTCNFAPHVTRVPYKTQGAITQEWNLCFGLFHSERDADGFMVPEFSWAQNMKLATPEVIPYNVNGSMKLEMKTYSLRESDADKPLKLN